MSNSGVKGFKKEAKVDSNDGSTLTENCWNTWDVTIKEYLENVRARKESWVFYSPFMGWNKGQPWFGEKGCEIYSVCVGERQKYLYGAGVCSIEEGVYLYKAVTYMFVLETSSKTAH